MAKKNERTRLTQALSLLLKRIEEDKSYIGKLEEFLEMHDHAQLSNDVEIKEIDIYAIFVNKGEDGLKNVLESENTETLKHILRQNRFVQNTHLKKVQDKEECIQIILDKTKVKMSKGSSFSE